MTWENAWREGRTGWDAGGSPPALLELVQAGELPGGRALVPGCGAGHDVLTLASGDRTVVGLDVAPTAAARFAELRRERGVPESQARIVTADFFEFEPDARFNLVWDYTFFCAIDPSQRPAWGRHMAELVAPGGLLVTLVFPVVPGAPPDRGPPYAIHPEDVRAALGDAFDSVAVEPVSESHPGREGKEILARWRRR